MRNNEKQWETWSTCHQLRLSRSSAASLATLSHLPKEDALDGCIKQTRIVGNRKPSFSFSLLSCTFARNLQALQVQLVKSMQYQCNDPRHLQWNRFLTDSGINKDPVFFLLRLRIEGNNARCAVDFHALGPESYFTKFTASVPGSITWEEKHISKTL